MSDASLFLQTFLDKKEVTERVVAVMKNFEKVDPAKVTPAAHFVNDLGLDSLDAVEVSAHTCALLFHHADDAAKRWACVRLKVPILRKRLRVSKGIVMILLICRAEHVGT